MPLQTRKDFPGRGMKWRPDTTWEVWGKAQASWQVIVECGGGEALGVVQKRWVGATL